MSKKYLFNIMMTSVVLAFALTACGGKGIDRKLNYSDTQQELGKSFGAAMAEALPEQQNVMRDRMTEIISSVMLLGEYSNPALVDAFVAKKNAEEFERAKNMTVRELFVWYMSARQAELQSVIPLLEKFQNGKALVVENVSIEEVEPKVASPSTSSISIYGTLVFRNDSEDFDYDFRGCQLALMLDDKQVEELKESNDCQKSVTIAGKGGKQSVKFRHSVNNPENIKNFFDLVTSGHIEKTGFSFSESKDSYLRMRNKENSVFQAGSSDLKKFKEELEKISAELAVFKK
jgi:hypothetical protein